MIKKQANYRFQIKEVKLIMLLIMLLIKNIAHSERPLNLANLNFIGVSDIHFDPFTGCRFKKNCIMVAKLNEKSISQWDKILASNKAQRRQRLLISMDPNHFLLNRTIKYMRKQIVTQSANFVIVTGDFIGHNLKKNYQRYFGSNNGYSLFVHKLFQYLHFKLQQAAQNTPVYFVMGNNDGYLGDYVLNADQQFFKDIENDWPLLNSNNNNNLTSLLSQSGTYSVLTKNNWRLIILNSNLFYKKIHGKNQDKYQKQSLKWLAQQLNNAELAKQKVLIFYHIPFGIFPTKRFSHASKASLWTPSANKAYIKLYAKYKHIIKGMIHGHVHRELFMKLHQDHKNIMPQYLISSISPIFGNRPSFSIFKFKNNKLNNEQFFL